MNILGRQQEVMFQNVINAFEESIVYLRGTAVSIDDPLICDILCTLAARRSRLCQLSCCAHSLPNHNWEEGVAVDLTVAINLEKTIALESSRRCYSALFSENAQTKLLLRRIENEEQLLGTIEDALDLDWTKNSRSSLEEMAAHIRLSVSHLQEVTASLNDDR